MSLFTRMRGVIGNAITWSVGWSVVGAVWGIVLTIGWPDLFGTPLIGSMLTSWGVAGFAGGTVFSLLLRATEGTRRFDELRMGRFALWGALGGAFLGLGLILMTVGLGGPLGFLAMATTSLLGAASAAGSLALARGAGRNLPGTDEAVDQVGLTAEERRELLGESS